MVESAGAGGLVVVVVVNSDQGRRRRRWVESLEAELLLSDLVGYVVVVLRLRVLVGVGGGGGSVKAIGEGREEACSRGGLVVVLLRHRIRISL